jgi:hypothetical protein
MCTSAKEGVLIMKIVNLEEFRKLPVGTLFMNYEPCIFGDLCAKGETWECDFLMEDITHEIDANDCGDFSHKLHEAEEKGTSVVMDFDCTSRDGMFDKKQLFAVYSRDGMFDKKQLFAVYEKVDIEMLQDKLKRCVESAYT